MRSTISFVMSVVTSSEVSAGSSSSTRRRPWSSEGKNSVPRFAAKTMPMMKSAMPDESTSARWRTAKPSARSYCSSRRRNGRSSAISRRVGLCERPMMREQRKGVSVTAMTSDMAIVVETVTPKALK